jgi:hypothetical protein
MSKHQSIYYKYIYKKKKKNDNNVSEYIKKYSSFYMKNIIENAIMEIIIIIIKDDVFKAVRFFLRHTTKAKHIYYYPRLPSLHLQ